MQKVLVYVYKMQTEGGEGKRYKAVLIASE